MDRTAASVGAYIALVFLVLAHVYIVVMMYLHMQEMRMIRERRAAKENFLSVPNDRFFAATPPPGTAHLAFPTRCVDCERQLLRPPGSAWAGQQTRCFSCESESPRDAAQFTHPNKCLSCEGHPDDNPLRS